jgi:hypothetical protein
LAILAAPARAQEAWDMQCSLGGDAYRMTWIKVAESRYVARWANGAVQEFTYAPSRSYYDFVDSRGTRWAILGAEDSVRLESETSLFISCTER